MKYNNYSISASKGSLYLKEKQPTEGYQEITYGSESKKTYHQYHSSMQGLPKKLELKEIDFEGRKLKFLEFTLTEGNDIENKVSMNLKNKGGYTDEVKLMVSALYNLTLGELIIFTPKKGSYTNKKGELKDQLNLYINYVNILGDNGKGKGSGFIPYSEIPQPIKEDKFGEVVWNWDNQTGFYYNKLNEIIARFDGQQVFNQPIEDKLPNTPSSSSKSAAEDLPF
jgi:hypothetical protein